jgi:hypothetical protein
MRRGKLNLLDKGDANIVNGWINTESYQVEETW